MTFGFILGWAACATFFFACEAITQLIAWRRARAAEDAERHASLTEMCCPWPLRHDELSARPDWITELHARSFGTEAQQENG